MKKRIYFTLAIIGLVVPYFFLVSFFIKNGFNLELLISQIFQTNGSRFFAVDVIISAIVLVIFIGNENKKRKIKFSWISILGTFTVGVSFGLPVFLFLKELSKPEELE
ncbi:DUF2834 domain-containing protein [Spirochaeta cellobiosiphila]|uniref:DUF2834 domain-containing protein n=1 Tax=Spirochaeta cellobiosiphila TaxID=504483 RepID=UPI000404B08B|nr:DUF2834 domain-containing protein [Spirochaeta cellobiosiphila]